MSSKVVKSLSAKFELLRFAVSSGDIVLITGLPSTGKTTLAKLVLEERSNYLSVYINCNNVATVSMLYLEILRLLDGKLNLKDESRRMGLKSTIVAQDFSDKYDDLCKRANKKGKDRIFVILDQVELLKRTPMMDAVVFMATKIGQYKMDFILISSESQMDFLDGISSANYRSQMQDKLMNIDLNVWTKDDLIETILEQLPTESVELYEKFVHNVVSTVYITNTKDFVELRSFCQENFEKFLEFYRNKTCEMLKKNGSLEEGVNFDNVDFDEYEEALPSIVPSICSFLDSFKDLIKKGEVRDWGHERVDRKVPVHTATLIVASYIAAYTRASDDKRNFVRFQKRLSKRSRMEHTNDNPKVFTMERLIHIYRSIIALHDGLDENCQFLRRDSALSDIQLLQDLDIISIHTGNGLDSQTRYRISHHVSPDYISRLGEIIEFSLESLIGLPEMRKNKK